MTAQHGMAAVSAAAASPPRGVRVAPVITLYAISGVSGAAAGAVLTAMLGAVAPGQASQNLLTVMSPWPWYIPELVLIGLASVLIYYAPFALKDRMRPPPP